jgi:hypothetical protein
MSEPQAQTQALAAYQPQHISLQSYADKRYNILAPTQSICEISPMHRLRVEVVKLSVVDSDRDVYLSKTFCNENERALGKNGIMKLARAAGVEFVPHLCRRVDDMKDPAYVCYEVVGFIRQPDGRPFFAKGMKEVDLREGGAEEAKLRKQAAAKMKPRYGKPAELNSKAEADAWVAKELLAAREHKLSNCETKAMLRCVRALLQIKPKYTVDELARPFVVPHLDFSPDYNDPEVRRVMLTAAAQAQACLYGEVTPPGPAQQQVRDMRDGGAGLPAYTAQEIQDALVVNSGDDDEDAEDIPLGNAPEATEQPAAAGDDMMIGGTSIGGWLQSLRDAPSDHEARTIVESLNRSKAEFVRAGRWAEVFQLAKSRLAELGAQ